MLRRLLSLAIVLVVLVILSFALVRLIPGDPAQNVLAAQNSTPEQLAITRHELGLDQPLPQQFATYVTRLSHGDLGKSFATGQPVSQLVADRLPPSAELAGVAVLVVMLVAVPLGMLAAAYTREGRHRGVELAFTSTASVIGGLPEFLAATLLAFIFAVWLRLLPVAGQEGLQSLVLPVAAISLRPVFVLARIVRLETLNVLALDYIRTARGKRLPTRTIYLRHVLPNVVTAALTIGGILGTALVSAAVTHDYEVVQAIVLVLGFTVVIVNAAVDIVLGIIDPRSLARSA
jgi:peptide/nickel transport system permease protein